jgi:periplasmic copper chaperone A
LKVEVPIRVSHRRVIAGVSALVMLLPYLAIAVSGDAVKISDAWARETAPGQSIGAAYMRIRSTEDVTLIGVASSASKSAELHQMSMKGDLMQMREVKTVKVSPEKEAALEPGGTHIMLVDLKRPLKVGDAVSLKLTFRRANGSAFVVPTSVRVRSMTAEAMHGH